MLLIASLFVVLGARITDAEIEAIRWQTFVFVAGLILVARPLVGRRLHARAPRSTGGRACFAAWMAPRGIVAAAVSSVFALRLQDQGEPGGAELVPAVFLTVVVTIAVYGLTAGPLARRLGLSEPDPQGVLILGASPLAVALGRALHDEGLRVLLADTDADSVAAAAASRPSRCTRAACSPSTPSPSSTSTASAACSPPRPTPEAAALAAMLYSSIFGRAEVYEVPILRQRWAITSSWRRSCMPAASRPAGSGSSTSREQLERRRRGRGCDRVTAGRSDPTTRSAHRVPLFCVQPDGRLEVATDDRHFQTGPGDRVVSFVLATLSPRAVTARPARRRDRRGRGCPGSARPCATPSDRSRRRGGAWPRPGRPATRARPACSRWPGPACRGSG